MTIAVKLAAQLIAVSTLASGVWYVVGTVLGRVATVLNTLPLGR